MIHPPGQIHPAVNAEFKEEIGYMPFHYLWTLSQLMLDLIFNSIQFNSIQFNSIQFNEQWYAYHGCDTKNPLYEGTI